MAGSQSGDTWSCFRAEGTWQPVKRGRPGGAGRAGGGPLQRCPLWAHPSALTSFTTARPSAHTSHLRTGERIQRGESALTPFADASMPAAHFLLQVTVLGSPLVRAWPIPVLFSPVASFAGE